MTSAARWRARWPRLVQLWGVGLAASLLVTGASALGYLEPLQARSLDLLMSLQGHRPPSGVVIVAVDGAAFESLGRRQPIARDYLARVIRGLRKAGAAAVGLDISLETATAPEADAELVRALREWSDGGRSRVVLADAGLPDSGPLAALASPRAFPRGAARVPVDGDGVIRRTPILLPLRGRPGLEPTLGLALAARLAGTDPAALTSGNGDSRRLAIPLWRPGEAWSASAAPPVDARPGEPLRINFVGPAGSFLTIPADVVAALAEPGTEIAADNPVRGNAVLIGGTFQESRDFHMTPYGPMPGVEIHANIVHMLVTRSFIRPAGRAASLGLQIAVVLVAGLIMVMVRPLAGTALCLAGALLVGVPASYLAFSRGGYWVDFLLPVLVTAVLGLGAEALARRRFRDAFNRYVSREVADQIVADPARLAGERRQVSILFSDLRGFTTLSESMLPERMAARLTEYFDAMTKAIFAHRGMVNDFVGDAIMAVFGAPLDDPDHALHAVESAAAMDRALGELNRGWAAAGLPALRMGIGIHTGPVFAGNVGGEGKVKYAVVGDAVNLASRVEGLNKELQTAMLVTDATYAAAGARLEVRDLGPVTVKGRREPVQVYELLALRPDTAGRDMGG